MPFSICRLPCSLGLQRCARGPTWLIPALEVSTPAAVVVRVHAANFQRHRRAAAAAAATSRSIMCDYVRNYYVYASCADPGAHFFRTSIDGSTEAICARAPHERFIVVSGTCPLC
ncbi:MAG: hypothetical protein M1826_001925 [Phylliscum demangeonii]|nr:MAG: hypothetical protein M1826_001925 [Phylliscum demangeonii]